MCPLLISLDKFSYDRLLNFSTQYDRMLSKLQDAIVVREADNLRSDLGIAFSLDGHYNIDGFADFDLNKNYSWATRSRFLEIRLKQSPKIGVDGLSYAAD